MLAGKILETLEKNFPFPFPLSTDKTYLKLTIKVID